MSANDERLLTPGEVARLFRVDPKTVARWARAGKLAVVRTPSGRYRYREAQVLAFLNGGTDEGGNNHTPN